MAPTVSTVPDTTLDALRTSLLNIKGDTSLHERFRALFTLKSIQSPRVIEIISEGFSDSSALLKHELAYVLGQMNDTAALSTLQSVLENTSEDPMVRHEAAEALGAISSESSIPVLEKYLHDPERTVRETCEIALDKIKWDHTSEGSAFNSDSRKAEGVAYTSVDPAPPTSGLISRQSDESETVQSLQAQLVDTSLPLFERYRAMFSLRNIGTPEAVDALASGFSDDSALFKHEIAFVFGQLVSPHSVPALLKVLSDSSELEMVRHEAAEALGSIATPEVLPYLKEWLSREDSPRVVRESCQVALDMWEYENSDQF